MNKALYVLVAVAVLYLFYSALSLAAFREAGKVMVKAQSETTQLLFDPEYVSPPPAEISYLSLEKGASVCRPFAVQLCSTEENERVCPVPPYIVCYTTFRLRMVVYILERGTFIAEWIVYYPNSWESLWWSPRFSGSGSIHLNASIDCVRDGYRAFNFPLYITKNSSTAWLQSINVSGLDVTTLQCSDQLCMSSSSVNEVTVKENKDFGGIVIRVLLNAPGAWSNVRVRVYSDGQAVYEFSKILGIPEEWDHNPGVNIRTDFGPLYLRKSGAYIIQVDVASSREIASKTVMYEKPLEHEQITVSIALAIPPILLSLAAIIVAILLKKRNTVTALASDFSYTIPELKA